MTLQSILLTKIPNWSKISLEINRCKFAGTLYSTQSLSLTTECVRYLSISGRRWCARDANAMSGEKNKERLRKREKFRDVNCTNEYVDLKWPDLRQLNVSTTINCQSNLMRGLSTHWYVGTLRNGYIAPFLHKYKCANSFMYASNSMTFISVTSAINDRDRIVWRSYLSGIFLESLKVSSLILLRI